MGGICAERLNKEECQKQFHQAVLHRAEKRERKSHTQKIDTLVGVQKSIISHCLSGGLFENWFSVFPKR